MSKKRKKVEAALNEAFMRGACTAGIIALFTLIVRLVLPARSVSQQKEPIPKVNHLAKLGYGSDDPPIGWDI